MTLEELAKYEQVIDQEYQKIIPKIEKGFLAIPLIESLELSSSPELDEWLENYAKVDPNYDISKPVRLKQEDNNSPKVIIHSKFVKYNIVAANIYKKLDWTKVSEKSGKIYNTFK